MSEERATLVGWLAPPREGPGFVIPLLRIGQSNALLAQTSDAQDRIADFEIVEPVEVHGADMLAEISVARGELTLWGYEFPGAEAQITNRAQLAAWLAGRIELIDDPMRKLQAIEFCELGPQMRDAWRGAYDQLAKHAPPSAKAWRDMVVVPARARLAIKRAMLNHKLAHPDEGLGSSVGVQVIENQVCLALEPGLYARISASPGALDDIERGTAAVCDAFDLNERLLTEPRAPHGGHGDIDAVLVHPIIVALGNLAIEALGRSVPRTGARNWRIAHPREIDAGEPVSLLVTHGGEVLHSGDSDIGSLNPVIADLVGHAGAHVVFVFEAMPETLPIVLQACKLARKLESRRLETIAAIPHLPAPADDAPAWREMQEEICKSFDAVCYISDQSPMTRSAQAFGPARSTIAAADRLAMLISRLELEDFRLERPKALQRGAAAEITVLTSAADRRTNIGPLVEHALARAMNPSFDLRGCDLARVTATADFTSEQLPIAHRILADEGAQNVDLSILSRPTSRHQMREVHLSLSGVHWLPGDRVDLEEYARRELTAFGWGIGPSSGPHCAFNIIREGAAIDIALSQYLSPAFPKGERGRSRSVSRDCVILTEVPVRRSVFAEHLLRGWMPLHVSRMRQIKEIFERRYASLLSALQKPSVRTREALERAAFRQFRANDQLPSGLETEASNQPMKEKWTLQADRGADIGFFRDAIRLDLAVRRHDRGSQGGQPMRATVVLHRAGWEVAGAEPIS